MSLAEASCFVHTKCENILALPYITNKEKTRLIPSPKFDQPKHIFFRFIAVASFHFFALLLRPYSFLSSTLENAQETRS